MTQLLESKECTPKLEQKVNVFWRDLLYYDDNLNKSYNDLSSFNNTSNLKLEDITESDKKHDLTYDVNKQFVEKNELPENAKYKGCVKKFMQANQKLFEGYLKWLHHQIQQEN